MADFFEKAQQGDVEAYGVVVQRFQDMAVGYAFSVLGDFHLAEDAAQEAFVEAFPLLHKVYDIIAFPCWLRRVVFKHCDRLMRRKKLNIVPLDAMPDLCADAQNPYEWLEEMETKTLVRDAVASLPEVSRQVISLFYISEYSHKEIADFLGANISTVKKRLYDARKRLKKRMIHMVEDDLRENRPSKDDQFAKRVLSFLVPDKEKHGESIYDMAEKLGGPMKMQWRDGRIAHSTLDWKTSRLGLVGDEIVTFHGIYDIQVRVGASQVKTAAFGPSWVKSDYKNQAQEMGDQTARESLQVLKEQGYDLALGFYDERGIYERLGFVPVWRALDWRVLLEDLSAEDPDFEVETFVPDERPDLVELFNRDNECLTGSVVRPVYYKSKEPGKHEGWLWKNEKGDVIGFITGGGGGGFEADIAWQKELDQAQVPEGMFDAFEDYKAGRPWLSRIPSITDNAVCYVKMPGCEWYILDGRLRLRVYEAGGKLFVMGNPSMDTRYAPAAIVDDAAGDPEQIVQVLGMVCRQRGLRSVLFDRLPYRSALGKYLRRLPSCRVLPKDRPSGNRYWAQIVNLRGVFEAIAPELSRRLSESLVNWQGELVVSAGRERVTLGIDGANISVTDGSDSVHQIEGGAEIVQLVFGSESPDEIVNMNGMEVSGDAMKLIHVLFPAQYPQLRNQDL